MAIGTVVVHVDSPNHCPSVALLNDEVKFDS